MMITFKQNGPHKSFPTKASYDRSKLRYMYLNEGDKIRECHN